MQQTGKKKTFLFFFFRFHSLERRKRITGVSCARNSLEKWRWENFRRYVPWKINLIIEREFRQTENLVNSLGIFS
jgi:hypothetical protein